MAFAYVIFIRVLSMQVDSVVARTTLGLRANAQETVTVVVYSLELVH
jgi:hypothetical protein